MSNFYHAPIDLDGEHFRSNEHAFQAKKTDDAGYRVAIREAETPGWAKRLGRAAPLRAGWENEKLGVMRRVLEAKFTQHPDLAAKLLATGDAEVIEENTWHDTVWGRCSCPRCRGRGQNHLGILLMHVREQLRKGGPWASMKSSLP